MQRFSYRLVSAAERRQGEKAENGVEQPPAGATTQLPAGVDEHPNDEREKRWRPYPTEGLEHSGAGRKDQEACTGEAHERGGNCCPALRLVCPARRTCGEQSPAQGECEHRR